MAQLSESVKAIYGANFDGYSYLKRLFNVEYALPPCKNHDYMRLLLGEYPELGSYDLELGLPTQEFVGNKEEKNACFVLTWVADSFNLELRSQRTVLEMIDAAAAGLPQGKKVHLIWLATLCALRHKNSAGFEAVYLAGSSKAGWENANISEINKTIRMPGGGYEEQTKTVCLRDIARLYYGVKDLDWCTVQQFWERVFKHVRPFRWKHAPTPAYASIGGADHHVIGVGGVVSIYFHA